MGSVYKAIKLYPESEKLDVIRANILSPPFKKEVFDILFCPRALHHTGNMEYGIEKLHSLIKREGVLAFSVYSQENNFLMWGIVEPLKGVVNRFLPDIILLGLASMLAALFKVVISFIFVPLDKINIKVFPLHKFFILWSHYSFKTIKINVYDLLHAPFVEYTSNGRFKEWEEKFHLNPIKQVLLHDTIWGYSARKM